MSIKRHVKIIDDCVWVDGIDLSNYVSKITVEIDVDDIPIVTLGIPALILEFESDAVNVIGEFVDKDELQEFLEFSK